MSYLVERPVKRITMPTNAEYWVEIIGGFKWKETKQFVTTSGDSVQFSSTADKILLTAIVNWNLDDTSGNVLPITQESIDSLEQVDVLFILDQLNLEADSSASKKNSSKQ